MEIPEREVITGPPIPSGHPNLISIAQLSKMTGKDKSTVLDMIKAGRRSIDGRTVRLAMIKSPSGIRTTEEAYEQFQELVSGRYDCENHIEDPPEAWTKNFIIYSQYVLFRFTREDLNWLILQLRKNDPLAFELEEAMEELIA